MAPTPPETVEEAPVSGTVEVYAGPHDGLHLPVADVANLPASLGLWWLGECFFYDLQHHAGRGPRYVLHGLRL